MREKLTIGRLVCDFLSQEEFRDLCNKWLNENTFHHIVTLNPEMVMLAQENDLFKQAVMTADIRTPDGAGLVWARWYLRSGSWPLWGSLMAFSFQSAQRITGIDTVFYLGKLAQEKNLPIYLLGGTGTQSKTTAKKLHQQFPKLQIDIAPPHQFEMEGPEEIIRDIQKKSPAILLVAYGAPKQTMWIEKNRHKLTSVRIAVGVGGAFAMIAEELPRAPLFMRQLNVEWLWRLLLEPSRLPRIFNAIVKFPLLVKKQKEV